ncbi:hypothetical protein FDP41_012299 [Naegleria fowleri]|uniref:alpha-1,2-Mannosidase n=1 Tax=Naegleria fowleri TaxID=5763 RepID=A0A6A5C4E6_NAEFO|nr:uncharacterized protein FDP41_012299 [Naegleria fowleri]KAF0981642.1 hypothetical protein FDP41_012299 [Naegleria fowleri]
MTQPILLPCPLLTVDHQEEGRRSIQTECTSPSSSSLGLHTNQTSTINNEMIFKLLSSETWIPMNPMNHHRYNTNSLLSKCSSPLLPLVSHVLAIFLVLLAAVAYFTPHATLPNHLMGSSILFEHSSQQQQQYHHPFINTVHGMSIQEQSQIASRIKEMFQFSFNSYMKYAFPYDELKPISCSGISTWGNYSLTLIDSLDTLYIMNLHDEFKMGVEYVLDHFNDFHLDSHVSVFETNIRILGGLLSAHLLALKHDWYREKIRNGRRSSSPPSPSPTTTTPTPTTTTSSSTSSSSSSSSTSTTPSTTTTTKHHHSLLTLSIDLCERLIKAFDTPTHIPYGMVHLTLGVLKNESQVTAAAGGGTFLMEFGLLSYLTGNMKYYDYAKRASLALYLLRDLNTNLIGNHVNIMNGHWTHRESGIGASCDSFFEYLFKGFMLFRDEELIQMFKTCYDGIMKHVYREPWYSDVDMKTSKLTFGLYNSLASFWPGLQTLYGHDFEKAKNTLNAIFGIWRLHGVMPEGFNLYISKAQKGQMPYPLRPEIIESVYHLYKFDGSRDSTYLYMARDFLTGLEVVCKTKCGYAVVKDSESKLLEDRMESFFLSETLKYLYLIFDPYNFVHWNEESGQEELLYTFNTEAHIIPLNLNDYLKKYNTRMEDGSDMDHTSTSSSNTGSTGSTTSVVLNTHFLSSMHLFNKRVHHNPNIFSQKGSVVIPK